MELQGDTEMVTETLCPPCVSAEAKETKKRTRLGKILSEIRRQIEFWFGDTNLHKDKFLRQVVDASPDGFVPLSVLMSFNRMKTLSTDINIIRRAVSTSTQLEVSSDGLKIRRSSPLGPKPEDEDERTVYVERLPHGVTHEWLSRVFSPCGRVLYVSLPRFRSSGDAKGFAFIEFSTSEEACRAVQMLHHPVNSVSAAGIFPKTRKRRPITGIDSVSDLKTQRHRDAKTRGDTGRKERRGDIETQTPGDTGTARTKAIKRGRETRGHRDTEVQATEEPVTSLSSDNLGKRRHTHEDKRHTKKQRRHTIETQGDRDKDTRGDRDIDTQGRDRKKETRRDREKETQEHGDKETQRRRQRHRGMRRHGDTVGTVLPHAGTQGEKEGGHRLCVMSKESWLNLRRDFIQRQKVAMGALKTTLRDAVTREAPVHSGSGGTGNRGKTADAKHSGKEPPPFVSGVIVRISCENGFPGRQEIKGALGDTVVYVDVSHGDTEGHVRFRKHEDAETVVSRGDVRHGDDTWTLGVLTGDAEQRYWQKILVDRQVKINRPREKKRGTSKLLDRVEKLMKQKADVITKHLRFEFD
ncbi:la-related protein 7 [Petromyzon marinus]|uniref:La-related protein 7 n=1 Tax=Petromyzon marinus TaxID=7757 RepID=A0AAJ7U5Q7_PETMA|nr:la-related protein 7 [Petromyzon marinus]XP_032830214.1 la-related protein 7 [Petromyzon marinus]